MQNSNYTDPFPAGAGMPSAVGIAAITSDPHDLRELVGISERAASTYLDLALSLADELGRPEVRERLEAFEQAKSWQLLIRAEREEMFRRFDERRSRLLALRAEITR